MKPILAPYDTVGSTRWVDFDTTKATYDTRDSAKCHVSHVVLDSDDGEPAFEPGDQVGETRGAIGAEPGRRLIQAQHARTLRQRHCDLERPAVAIGQEVRGDVSLLG